MAKISNTARTLKIVPALIARTQLGQILSRVRQNHERFVVDKRGEPQAVIMSVEEYLRTLARQPAALAQIQREAKAKRLDLLPCEKSTWKLAVTAAGAVIIMLRVV